MLFVAGWWQGSKGIEWGLAGTVALSFVGVALLMRPSLNADQLLGGAISLVSGVLSALVYLQGAQAGAAGEPEYRVVFYFSATGVLAGLVGSVVTGRVPLWHSHSGTGVLLVVMIGLTATLAQIAMTRAYRLGNTLVTANLQYTGIVFSSLFGVLIWNDARAGSAGSAWPSLPAACWRPIATSARARRPPEPAQGGPDRDRGVSGTASAAYD
jgi:S-adenosylmethionine uptake transporter